jgi:glycosidase
MQWAPSQSAGFSSAAEKSLVRPVRPGGEYGYRAVNVRDQRCDPGSLLAFFHQLIRARRAVPEVGWGTWSVIETDAPGVLAHRCDWQDCALIAVHNLRAERVNVALTIAIGGCLQEVVLADGDYPQLDETSPSLTLQPYGYYWLRLRHPYGSDLTAGERV